TVSGARNLPDWGGSFELGQALAESLGAPVRVGNDVGVATQAEAQLGAGRAYRSLRGVFWGTGVGGGLVLDGRHWLGRGGGGGIGVRLGQPYAERIANEMRPHLFNGHRPPAVEVAALGDLGGAIGAALLVASSDAGR